MLDVDHRLIVRTSAIDPLGMSQQFVPSRLCLAAIIAAAVALGACGSNESSSGQANRGNCARGPGKAAAVTLRYRVESSPGRPGSFEEARKALCTRLRRLGLRRVSVLPDGPVLVVRARRSQAADVEAATRLSAVHFYDWDANVSGSRGPDEPFSGATAFFDAVRAASRMKPEAESTDVAPGATTSLEEADIANDTPPVERHYLFGADRRLLAGPAWSSGTLAIARGATSAAARILTVPRGVMVVEAQREGEGAPQYSVLEDDAELSPADVSKPTAGMDQATREPIVELALSEPGRTRFAALTRRIAERSAATVALGGAAGAEALGRVAILLDDRVVSLTTIDPRANPQGIDGSTGVQIRGMRTAAEARRLALLMAEKPFPAHLVPLTPPR
jgi:preprotein translocase subunit SecD